MFVEVEGDVSGLDDESLRELVVGLEAESDRLEALRLKVLGEWDARAVWAVDGACNGAGWLAALGRQSRGACAGAVRDARTLRTMPTTAAALEAGRLAPAKARLLARAVNARTREAFVRDEAVLVELLAGLSVDHAAQAVRFWSRNADADGPKPDSRDANFWHMSRGFNGRWQGKYDLDDEWGTILSGVMDGFAERIRRERREQGLDVSGMGGWLRAEAAIEMARRATAAPDSVSSSRPLVWVLAGQEQLESGHGVCELAGGGVISAVAAQRLACHGDIARLSVNADGERINLGRAQRRASATQRRLLWLRDGGCVFPGCGRPPGWCESHHLVFWEAGGPTDLANLVLLCAHHHHLCHEGGFRARRIGDELVFSRPDGTRLEPPGIAA